jgi:hypothetical protein
MSKVKIAKGATDIIHCGMCNTVHHINTSTYIAIVNKRKVEHFCTCCIANSIANIAGKHKDNKEDK